MLLTRIVHSKCGLGRRSLCFETQTLSSVQSRLFKNTILPNDSDTLVFICNKRHIKCSYVVLLFKFGVGGHVRTVVKFSLELRNTRVYFHLRSYTGQHKFVPPFFCLEHYFLDSFAKCI